MCHADGVGVGKVLTTILVGGVAGEASARGSLAGDGECALRHEGVGLSHVCHAVQTA